MTTVNVLELADRPTESDRAELTMMVDDLVRRHAAGELRSLHVVVFTTDGSMMNQSAGRYSNCDAIAAFEVAKFDAIMASEREHV